MSVTLRSATTVTFREVPEVPLSDAFQVVSATFWERARRENPALYNGPILVASGLMWAGDSCEVSFFESSFSRYLWSRRSTCHQIPRTPTLFASVVATTLDGALLAGRMSESTSTPGRVQLPGGNIEMQEGSGLSLATAKQLAARELAEEVGIEVNASDLQLTHVKSGGDHGDVGIFFSIAPPLTLSDVVVTFANHLSDLAANSSFVEFSQLVAFSHNCDRTFGEKPFTVDYMDTVLKAALGLGNGEVRYRVPQGHAAAAQEIGVEVC